MLLSILNRKHIVSMAYTFLRRMHRGSCGNHSDDPPCPPQDPPKPPFSCESMFVKRKEPNKQEPRCSSNEDDKPKDICKSSNPNKPIFNNPECCITACPDLFPRYDDMFYKSSDKAKRCYRQTWVECPEPIKKQKVECCFEKTSYPPIEKRALTSRPKTACSMGTTDCGQEQNGGKCMRISLPGCRSRRSSFKCLVENNPRSLCKNRRCSPYPSFSECARKKSSPIKPIECACLTIPGNCEIWAEIEKAVRMGSMNKMK